LNNRSQKEGNGNTKEGNNRSLITLFPGLGRRQQAAGSPIHITWPFCDVMITPTLRYHPFTPSRAGSVRLATLSESG
jgi:hypothetical protein